MSSALARRHVAVVVAAVVLLGLLTTAPAFASSASATNSSAIVNLGTDTTATSDARIIHPEHADVTPGSQAATVVVSVKDDAGNPITADTLTVASSGSGLLGTGTGSPSQFVPTGHLISVTVSNIIPGKYVFGIFGDGTSGFSTVTIYDGQNLVATKFATFYGEVASISVLQNHRIVSVDGTPLGSDSPHNPGDGTFANTPAVILTVKDAHGIPTPDENAAEFSAISSDLSVLSPEISIAKDDTLGAGSLGVGTYNVQVRSASGALPGKSATLTFRYSEDGIHFISSAPVTFTTGYIKIHRVAMSFDQDIYAPGDRATVIIRAFDISDNPVSCQDAGNFFAFSTGLVTSAPINKMLFPVTTLTLMSGKAMASFNMPTTTGQFTLSGRLGNGPNLDTSLQGQPISATVSILNQLDVNMAATRASADAAENAANNALSAVRSLTVIVKALAAIVLKIQKKLGIK